MAGLARDPVSVLFDTAARKLLARAYARPGAWTGTRLAVPSVGLQRQLARQGIQWAAADQPSTRGRGGLNARTRWGRGFVRALYYQHKWYSSSGRGKAFRGAKRVEPRHTGALEVQIGRAMAATATQPAGRAVRIRVHRYGGPVAGAAAAAQGRDSWVDTTGHAGPRWSDPALRDW